MKSIPIKTKLTVLILVILLMIMMMSGCGLSVEEKAAKILKTPARTELVEVRFQNCAVDTLTYSVYGIVRMHGTTLIDDVTAICYCNAQILANDVVTFQILNQTENTSIEY